MVPKKKGGNVGGNKGTAASSIAMLGSACRNTLQHHFPCFWKNRARFAVSQTEISNAHLMQWQQFVLSKNYPSPVFFLSFFFFFLCTRKNTYSFERPICSFPSTCRSESGLTSAPQLLSLSRFLCRAICHTPVLASFPSHRHAAEQTTAPRWKSSIPVPLGALQSSPPA